MRRGARERGFSLLEVVVALSILSLGLIVLLQAQGQSLSNAGVSRDVSMATLLARSKMIDIEQKQFQEGFVQGEQSEDGDFAEAGFADVRWRYTITPVELDLSALTQLCSQLAPKDAAPAKAAQPGAPSSPAEQCDGMIGSLSGLLSGFTQELGDSMRTCELRVTWPEGKYERHITLRTLLTRDDFSTLAQGDSQRTLDKLAPGGLGAQGSGAPSPSSGGGL